MVCLSCMQKKTRSRMPPRKKDVGNYYMSYKWAIPTWNFFHSFASKINADFYAANRGYMPQDYNRYWTNVTMPTMPNACECIFHPGTIKWMQQQKRIL